MFYNIDIRHILNGFYALFIRLRSNPAEKEINMELISQFLAVVEGNDLHRNAFLKLNKNIKELSAFELKGFILHNMSDFKLTIKRYDKEVMQTSFKILKDICNSLLKKYQTNEIEKVEIMASSVHNYPHFLMHEYKCDPITFWNEHICYYSKTYNEPFLLEWEKIFIEYYPKKYKN
jgi:hypothetical protein